MATLFNTKIKDTYQSLLKLEDNTILTTTSKNITDGLGNASPLYMSTTQVRIGSTSASALYWDNVNNRLGIGTSSPAQPLSVNGQILSINGRVSTGTTWIDYDGSFNSAWGWLRISSAGNIRLLNSTAIGADIVPTATLHVKGSGSTSATTSLLVQNSGGNSALTITDNLTTTISGTQTNLSTSKVFVGALSLTAAGTSDTGNGIYSTGGDGTVVIATSWGGGTTSGGLQVSGWAGYTTSLTSVNKSLLSIINSGFSDGNIDNLSGNTVLLRPTYNFLGTRSGITVRGIYYNPTLTSLVSTTHIAIETVTGDVLLGTTSGRVGIGTNSPKYLLANTDSTAPTGFQSHTAGSNSLYWKIGQVDKYAAVFENTAGYGDGVLIKVANNTHSGLLVTSNNATLLDVSDDQGGIYSPRVTSGSRVSWLFGYVEHAGGVGTNIYGNGATPFITLREYSYHVGIGTTSPSARLTVTGGGSTSATSSLLVQNSSGNRLLETKDNGDLYVGNTASNTGTIYVPHSPTYVDRVFMRIEGGGSALFSTVSNALLEISCSQFYTKGNMAMRNMNQGIIGQLATQTNNSSIQLTTSVNSYNGTNQNDACNLLYVKNNGVTLQASGSVNWIKMDGTVNEAGGGGAKWCTGIYYNPTLTGGTLLANSHYCYHATSGQMMVNTTSPQSSAQLQVDSTTRGLLPPRMTDAQIRAIVSPVNGLVAYNTTIDHLCAYQGGAWVKFNHSPM